jgi:hypothetical protein
MATTTTELLAISTYMRALYTCKHQACSHVGLALYTRSMSVDIVARHATDMDIDIGSTRILIKISLMGTAVEVRPVNDI